MSDIPTPNTPVPAVEVTLTTVAATPARGGMPYAPATATATVIPVPAPPPEPPSLLGALRIIAGLPVGKAVTLLLTLTFCYVVYQNTPLIGSLAGKYVEAASIARTTRVHETALNDLVLRERQTKALLAGLRDSNMAARASAWLFHNGTESLQGVPFLKMTETNEATSPGVSSERESHQSMALVTVADWLPSFLNDTPACIEQEEVKSSGSLRAAMRAAGTEYAIVCPVFAGKREPAGFLALSFTRGWPAPKDKAAAIASLRAAAVAQGAVYAAYRDSLR